MVEIRIAKKCKDLSEWEDQLQEMTVGYTVNMNDEYDTPKIIHCRKEYVGREAIYEYLQELAKFAEGWKNCFCEG